MVTRYNHFSSLPVVADTDIDGMVSRLEAIFLSGTPQLVAGGARWYADRHQELQNLSLITGIDVETLAYVASALSPQTEWRHNLTALYQTLDGWCNHDEAPVRSATLYAANDAKAYAMLGVVGDAELRRILGKGPKTHAFARNLQEKETLANGELAVTVDTVTFQAATGFVPSGWVRGKRYQRVAAALSFLARKYGLPVYVLQAVIWTIYRNTGA